MRLNMQFYFVCFVIFNFNKKGYSRLSRLYLGCYQHFDQYVVQKDKSSVTTCIEECKTDHRQYTFAALKNGTECYCGNNFRISTQESNCQKRCKDSSNEICGGEQHYSVYSICIIGSHGQHCDKPCSNCKSSVPCMRNNGECYLSKCHKNSNEKCDIARFFNDVNIAFDRPAYQNSTYQDDQQRKYPASLAVDGKNDSNFGSGKTCSHTNDDDKPWFYVDLEAERDVKKVIITNRDDHNANRLHGARVHLTNNPPNGNDYYCGYVAVTPSVPKTELECRSPSKYRYVAVTLSKKEFLTICEIEVYVGDCQNAGDCGSNESCVNLNFNGRYHKRCSCKEGFYKENVYSQCTDFDECKNNKHMCNLNSTWCNNTFGSYHCECKPGFKRNGYPNSCADIDECSTNHSCNKTTSSCVNNVGSYTCQCKEGYVNAGNNIKCLDEDECRRYNPVCDQTRSICRNSDGSYHCECKTGYEQDKTNRNKCKDIDECQNTNLCDSRSSTCRNKDGSYVCECKVGYHGFNSYTRTCVDINECDQRKCDASSTTCENVIGSFKCHCKPGFKPLSHNICSDIDECTEGNHNCDLSTTTCKNFKGSFSCDCKVGFEKVNSNNTSCRDVDECSRNVCDVKSTNCQNNHGSYLCLCKDGYTTLHQNKCSDMDECSTNNHDCDEQTTTCKNFEGGYKCHCLGGYENINGNNKSCRDIDECQTNNHKCNLSTTTCTNIKGSYRCDCKMGFKKVFVSHTFCNDVDECGNNKHECDIVTNICLNTEGSYICKCKSGYQQDGKSNKCTDIDECLYSQKYDSTVDCTNTEGSFKMSCPKGFNLIEEDGISTCQDVDECLQLELDSNVRCINLEGDYAFSCPFGMYLDAIDGKYVCKVPSNAAKIAAGLMSIIVLILGILLIFLWKRTKCQKYVQHSLQNDLFLVCSGKEVGQTGNYHFNPKYGESKLSSGLNEYLKINPEKKYGFKNKFRELVGRSFEEIRDGLSPKEITIQSDTWKVYSADGANIPNKYIFASFPSEYEVEKFWELSMKHSNVIVLIDHAKDSELPFLPNDRKTLKYKEFCLNLIKTENKGFFEVISIAASCDEDFYENMDGPRPQENKHGEFVVILVHLRNKDFLTNKMFLEIKNQTDLVSYSNSLDGRASSIFVLSRDDIKMASFYVACCKLFDQMTLYQEDEYTKLFEIVT